MPAKMAPVSGRILTAAGAPSKFWYLAKVQMTVTPDRVMQLGLGFWGSTNLLSAIELGVFTMLVKGPMDLHNLTVSLGLQPRGSRDFFDVLVDLGMLG